MWAQPSLTVAPPPARFPARRAEGYEVILINSNPVRPSQPSRAARGSPASAQPLPAAREGCVFCAQRAPLRPRSPAPLLTPRPRARVQATIMTDPETANRTYIGPMTPELVETIIAKARHCPRCAQLRTQPTAHQPRWCLLGRGLAAACAATPLLTLCGTAARAGKARCVAAHHGRPNCAQPRCGAC